MMNLLFGRRFFDRQFPGVLLLIGFLGGSMGGPLINTFPGLYSPARTMISLSAEERESSPIFDKFPWGQTFTDLKSSFGEGVILKEKSGESLVIRRGALEFLYQFFWKKKVDPKTGTGSDAKGEESDTIALRGAGPPGGARLYAVLVRFPHVPLHPEDRRRLLDGLSRSYGPIRNQNDRYFELEGQGTLVRGYLGKYRDRTFLLRIVFLSRSLGAERNEHLRKLKTEQEGLIRELLRKKEMEKARRKKREREMKKKGGQKGV